MIFKFLKFEADTRCDSVIEKCILSLSFLFPVCFMAIRGWSNSVAFIMGLVSAVAVIRFPREYLLSRDKRFWFIVFALIAPFVAEIIAQVGRFEFDGPSLDGPSRFFLGASIFIILSKHRNAVAAFHAVSLGSAVGLVITFLTVCFIDDSSVLWQNRAATYFVDPITLACYSLVIFLISMYFVNRVSQRRLRAFIVMGLVLSLIYILATSGSRTSWVSMVLIVLLVLMNQIRKKVKPVKSILTGLSSVVVIVALIFVLFPFVGYRLHQIITDLELYATGNPDSSIGTRIDLFRLDYVLVKDFPWFGLKDGSMPPFSELRARAPWLSEVVYKTKILAGSHSEISGQFVRKGVPAGFLANFALFVFPILFFVSRLKDADGERVAIARISLLVTLSLLASSFGIQIFNLKMTSTFWSVFLAIAFAALYLPRNQTVTDSTPHL
jgi:O-antigen ligase